MTESISLKSVWRFDNASPCFDVKDEYSPAKEILLITDGQGLSGYYDRIHILKTDGSKLIIPAHNAKMWEVLYDD